MTLVILGGGESGIGAALLAKKLGLDVFVSDANIIATQYKHFLITHNIPFEEGGHSEEKVLCSQEVIKSPGIPNDIAIVELLLKSGIPIIDEIEFAARYGKGKIIAITGSNGKSTTTYLTYHLLKEAGFHVAIAGNMGYSFARCIAENSYDYYILELSSFQLDGINNFKADIACLLNITSDHLDRYSHSIAAYARAKLNILRNMSSADHFIYNADDPIINQYLYELNTSSRLYPISIFTEMQFLPAIYSNNEACYFKFKEHAFSINHNLIHLPGPHNRYNTMAAVTIAMLVGVPLDVITSALPSFYGLPHRIEWCGAPQNVNCYNDSKATNIASVQVALLSFNCPIIWIVGGKDKGNDYTVLLPIIREKVKAIICLGKDNATIMQAFYPLGLPMQETNNMSSAVDLALSMALPGEVILLSPACASFDLFKNFEDRGNQFKKKITCLLSNEKHA
ncbi:UDP-N-acetylmuramoyl-L-alanine--D-glutamate ligase [Cardinium endosymbiont of Culicoides punctatus]|uniref:UDP-N-acetylmuramoyl-L-alanine--D-glutamate ligase n=1 Tax=Cardinium endosymbiont of Culicoides punctatus TaxID=2304601 RepID=UPI0010E7C5A1|nr:UDP-N-acetylmuramoyl-L-alanine--D-glutamate ligase [Cardinium endosymbiont of Culicoides punctatus]TDG94942.1 UDP-N-acetylmuramoylalanine--D-glutamate ligase [Cardinium endosymbiont of Culicoides punctatus]